MVVNKLIIDKIKKKNSYYQISSDLLLLATIVEGDPKALFRRLSSGA